MTYLYPAGAQRGTTVEVTAAGTLDPWPVQVWASGKGVSVQPSKDKGKLSVKVDADAVPGVYWLRAHNAEGASPLRPFVVGMLPEVTEQEPNDEPKKAQVIKESCVVNGRLAKSGDVDCFALPLKKGQTLVASVEANRTLRSPMDGVLQVLSPDGFVVANNNDFHGLDPQLAYTAPKDGTYTARVFAFPATPDSSIRFAGAETYIYRLTLTTEGFAHSAFPLAVSRKEPGTVEAVGWNIPDAGKKLPVTPDRDDQATLFHPGIANPFRVRIEPHAVLDAPSLKAAPPFSVSGRVEKGNAAAFPFSAKKGQAISVQVQSRSFGLPLSPVVAVVDAAGKQLARAEPAKLDSDAAVSFTPPADGVYTVQVSDLYAAGGPRHAFLLRVVPVEPDYELTVAADRFTLTPGKPTAVAVKVTRRNGFTKPVEIVAEGLPDGVSLKTDEAKKPDPAVINLTLTSEKPDASAPLRLVGRVKDEAALTRPVRFASANADAGEPTNELWLTVLAAPKK